jgi:hypothetical protein
MTTVRAGEFQRDPAVLLNQNDRQVAFAAQLQQHLRERLHDHRREPSVGSSIRSTDGLVISARAMASICCSPPESCVPAFAEPALQIGEEFVHARSVPWPGARADLQVLQHRQRGKISRSCGT